MQLVQVLFLSSVPLQPSSFQSHDSGKVPVPLVAPAEIDLGDGQGGRGKVPVPPVAPAETDFLGEGRRGELRRPEGIEQSSSVVVAARAASRAALASATFSAKPRRRPSFQVVLVRCRAMLIMFCGGLCFVLMTITIIDNPASSLSGYCSIQQRS